MGDKTRSWNNLHGRFGVSRIDHSKLGQASTRTSPKSSSAACGGPRSRHHRHIAGTYLVRFAQEAAFREDRCRMNNGRQVKTVAELAMKAATSVDWCGYWQRAVKIA
jgi:hypothetical protein